MDEAGTLPENSEVESDFFNSLLKRFFEVFELLDMLHLLRHHLLEDDLYLHIFRLISQGLIHCLRLSLYGEGKPDCIFVRLYVLFIEELLDRGKGALPDSTWIAVIFLLNFLYPSRSRSSVTAR